MKRVEELIEYFCEYDLYDSMLSNKIKDGQVTDILLSQCKGDFLSKIMNEKKTEKIWKLLRGKLSSQITQDKELVFQYVGGSISLTELFDSLPFKNRRFLSEPKEKVEEIQKERDFAIYYPVFLICNSESKKQVQQPLLSFACTLESDVFQINKMYINKDILSVIIAQQKEIEFADARFVYEKEIDEIAAAVDAMHPSGSIDELYQLVCAEFEGIFKTSLRDFKDSLAWKVLEKVTISFGSLDSAVDNCFQDELRSVERFYKEDHILPETVCRYLGVREGKAENICSADFTGFYAGSYQDKYPVNRKQWELVQAAERAEFLCVEGPPGTGKTTLLKEMIANTLVKKADALTHVWDKEWAEPLEEDKGVYRSPLGGKNLNSIVISSTNNKAIDNIGLELLQEISFFPDFISRLSRNAEMAYTGSLCARLGRADNINTFYKTFFAPFCAFLDSCHMEPQEANAIKEKYLQMRRKLNGLNDTISEFFNLRSQFEQIHSGKELNERKGVLEEQIKALEGRKGELEQQIQDHHEAKAKLIGQYQQQEQELRQYRQKHEKCAEQLRGLYSDLERYEKIGSLQRFFSFMLPQVSALLKKYGSAEQIRDMIQEIKGQQTSYAAQIDSAQQLLSRISSQEVKMAETQAELSKALTKNGQEVEKLVQKCEMLSKYQNYAADVEKHLACSVDDVLGMDIYELRNAETVVRLRKEIFDGALRLFEAYICLHREPIKSNLELLLTQKESENGSFYNWCQSLYNGDKPYSPNRAELVRALWETFFLCFPVVTTTLHSFRKSVFQMIPNLFDALMIDESGQIVPYYLVAPLYRARRAVVVGDVNQIEPIKNVPPHLLEKKYTQLLGEETYKRFCVDFSSAQDFAVCASEYYEVVQDKMCGVVLNEHRRCEPAIMAFSNQYVYHNVLELKGEDDPEKLFGSNLVAFDIRGLKATQHYNQAEIDACKEIVELFVKMHGQDVLQDIGIITPFRRQAQKIGEAIQGVEVGTTHVFQGAEKKYILFSSVIDDTPHSSGLSRFIGGKGNLLNVAFSRAKKQFIFVGNLQAAKEADNYLKKAVETIQQKGKVFSLFEVDKGESIEDQDVVRVLAGTQGQSRNDSVGSYLQRKIPQGIIDIPKLHNEILNDLIHMAMQSVFIISPWIGGNVVTKDMLREMREKVQGGVSIHIKFGYSAKDCSLADIDQLVKKDVSWGQEDSAEAIRGLREILGDDLKYEPPSHVKLLLVDDRYLFIGSLNWLYNSGKTEQKELSCLVTNPNTIQYVKEKFF